MMSIQEFFTIIAVIGAFCLAAYFIAMLIWKCLDKKAALSNSKSYKKYQDNIFVKTKVDDIRKTLSIRYCGYRQCKDCPYYGTFTQYDKKRYTAIFENYMPQLKVYGQTFHEKCIFSEIQNILSDEMSD